MKFDNKVIRCHTSCAMNQVADEIRGRPDYMDTYAFSEWAVARIAEVAACRAHDESPEVMMAIFKAMAEAFCDAAAQRPRDGRRGTLRVKSARDGTWFAGATAEAGLVWTSDRSKAAEFDDIGQFRQFESAARHFSGWNWKPLAKEDLRFVRAKHTSERHHSRAT